MASNFLASGQVTVTTAGTAVALTTSAGAGEFAIKADPDNTGVMYIGNDGAGDVTAANGFPLSIGEGIIVKNPDNLFVDSTVNGEKVNWLKVSAVP